MPNALDTVILERAHADIRSHDRKIRSILIELVRLQRIRSKMEAALLEKMLEVV